MSAALSEALKEAYAMAPSNVVVLDTLELSHPDLPGGALFLVKNNEDVTCTLEDAREVTFQAVGFALALPSNGENGVQELLLTIDNVEQQASDFVEAVRTSVDPIKATYRPFLSSDLTAPQMDPPLVLELTDVEVTLTSVACRGSFGDLLNKKFPTQLYTRARFPSLGS